MKSMRKITAIFLALLMILAVSPIAVFADDPEDPAAEETGPVAEWYTSYGFKRGEGTFEEAIANVTTAGKIVLLGDTELTDAVVFTKDITIDGAGHAVKRADTFGGVLFTVNNGAKVVFTNLVVDGNKEDSPAVSERLVTIANGSLLINNRTILKDNFARYTAGAAVKVGVEGAAAPECSFTMMPGTSITGCTGSTGGAISVAANSTAEIKGTISECGALTYGGAIDVMLPSSTLILSGAKITKCEASLQTGGAGSAVNIRAGKVSIIDSVISGNEDANYHGAIAVSPIANLKIGGSTVIYDNLGMETQSNIFVYDGAEITVEPSFTIGAKLGITTEKGFHVGDSIDYIKTTDDITGFIYNDADGLTFYVSNGNVMLLECVKVTFDAGNGVCAVESKIYPVDVAFGYLPEPEEREGFEFEGWYTANDKLVTTETPVYFTTDFTLYAKWKNLNALDTNPLAFIGRFFERIGNLLKIVVEFLQKLFTGTGGPEGLEGLK